MRQASSVEDLIRGWDGLGVVSRYDEPTGTWIFIALHDDALGRPTGGTRLKPYPTPADALLDAQRLAEGMTHKWAAAGLPFGGGKAVLAVPEGGLEDAARRGLLHRYGALVESLRGTFATGEDLGTTPADMAQVARRTSRVLGLRGESGGLEDPGPFTARGVRSAVRAACRRALGGDGGLAGLRVLVQGVGDVGGPLARELATDGASLVLADADDGRAAALAAELGAEMVAADAVYDTPCDVFAPCAVGAVLNPTTVPRLTCRVVAGSANNQLASDADAEALHERGILYAPDYVANAGGAIAFARIGIQPETPAAALLAEVERIGGVLDEVFAEAGERGESPLRAARRRVDRILDEARRGKTG